MNDLKLSTPVPNKPPEPMASDGPVSAFLFEHFKHFNAATVVEAAEAYKKLIGAGGKMFVSLAGAMSTAELGKSLAEMIRQDKIHGISCTGANLEEDVFNLVAHDSYVQVPAYRDLTPKDEGKLLDNYLARVTDTCIPEREAMDKISDRIRDLWKDADRRSEAMFPHEFLYELLRSGDLEPEYQIPPEDSWMLAAMEKNLPIFVPGWEDSTLGNMYAAEVILGRIKNPYTCKSGIDYMVELCDWYPKVAKGAGIGFFQIAGGIAGDFSICAVPLLRIDLHKSKTPHWAYFCQISDSTTSYGSYSGAVPNEKITWDKLSEDTPRFVIESDATIVAPLVFAIVMGK